MAINERPLAGIVSGNWWTLLLRGVIAIVFGILTFSQPGISLAALVLLFGAFSFVDGIVAISAAVAGRRRHDDWWMLLLGGVVGVIVGILTVFVPGLTALVLLVYIAVWAIATGASQIALAVRLRKEIEGEWILILAGFLSVLFGILLLAQPGAGILALLWLIGSYAIVFGALLVFLALKVRNMGHRLAHV